MSSLLGSTYAFTIRQHICFRQHICVTISCGGELIDDDDGSVVATLSIAATRGFRVIDDDARPPPLLYLSSLLSFSLCLSLSCLSLSREGSLEGGGGLEGGDASLPPLKPPRQALRTLSRARSWSRLPVLGAISRAFIAKSCQNLPKLTLY